MNNKNPIFIFAAGGTGGHIMPALAIAEQLKEVVPNAEIHFVGTVNGLENQIVPSKGWRLHHITIGRLNKNVGWMERLTTILLLPWAFMQSVWLMVKLKPLAVVGTGGHASGPVLLMATLLGKKTFLWEPNAFPGLANRLLSPIVTHCFVIFEKTLQAVKAKSSSIVGYPLRKELDRKELIARSHKPFRIFIFGGSQGARPINYVVRDAILQHQDFFADIEVVHQTGRLDFQNISQSYQQLPTSIRERLVVQEFINNMEYYYAKANLAVCRCGMGTIAELSAMSLPALLVPLPSAADNHQQKNAEEIESGGGGIMILQKDFTPQKLIDCIEKLKTNFKTIDAMSEKIHKFHKPNAAKEIVRQIMNLC